MVVNMAVKIWSLPVIANEHVVLIVAMQADGVIDSWIVSSDLIVSDVVAVVADLVMGIVFTYNHTKF